MKFLCLCTLLAEILPLAAQAPASAQPPDVAVVLDVLGEWFLEGESETLRAGRALPARGVLCSGISCQPPRTSQVAGNILIQYYGRTRADDPYAAPGRYPLPDVSGPPLGFLDRFLRTMSRILGQQPESYVPTISYLNPAPLFVTPSYAASKGALDPSRGGVYYLSTWERHVDLFSTNRIISMNEPFLSNEQASLRRGRPSPDSAGLALKLANAWSNLSAAQLEDGVVSSENGWVNLAPVVGNKPTHHAVAFKWIAGGREGAPTQRPELLFSWPETATDLSVSLPSGLYRATYFDLSLHQPIGRDAWILIVPQANYKSSKLMYDEAVQLTSSWPTGISLDAVHRYRRAFLRFLADPTLN